jgi:hypothetical protein
MNLRVMVARRLGDRRPRRDIETDINAREDEKARMWAEKYDDRDIKETVIDKGHNYPLIGMFEGEVVTRSLVYAHPMLAHL